MFAGWLTLYAALVAWMTDRRTRSMADHLEARNCRGCGYPLKKALARCPECGLTQGEHPRSRRSVQLLIAAVAGAVLLILAPRFIHRPGTRLGSTQAQRWYGRLDAGAAPVLRWIARDP